MAPRYWVPVAGVGSGDWSDTAHWSDVSGGAGGFSVPTNADDVFFDAASSPNNYVVTVNTIARNCLSLVATAPASGNLTITHGFGVALQVYGSLTLYSGMTYSPISGALIMFASTSTGRTINTAGTTIGVNIDFNGTGGGWTLAGALTQGAGNSLTFTRGSFSSAGFAITTSFYSVSGSNTRSVNVTNSLVTINHDLQSIASFNGATTTGLTFTTTGSTFVINATQNNSTSMTFPLRFDPGGLSFNNLTFATTSYTPVALSSNCTVTGLLSTSGGNANSQRLMLRSNTRGTQRTITCTGSTPSLVNTDCEDLVIAGSAAPASGTSIGNCGNCSGITFTPAGTRFWVGNGGDFFGTTRWALTSGGGSGASMPLPQDTAIFDAASFSSAAQSITFTGINNPRLPNLDLSAVDSSPTLSITTPLYCFGSVSFPVGLLIGGTNDILLSGRGSHTASILASANVATQLINVDCFGGTYTLSSDIGVASPVDSFFAFVINSGTLTTNDFNLYLSTASRGGTGTTRALNLGSSGVYLHSTSTSWNFGATTDATLTLNAGTSTIYIRPTTAVTGTGFAGGGYTYANVVIDTGAGANTITVSGAPTIGRIRNNTSVAWSLRFTGGTTNTFASFAITGSASAVVTVESTNTTNYNLVLTGGGRVNETNYLNISRATATPATDTWYVGVNSIDGGNNTGLIFGTAPGGTTSQLLSRDLYRRMQWFRS